MKEQKKAKVTVLLASALLALAMTGCGSGGGADAEHNYSVWLYQAQDSSYYTDYSENPTLQYLLGKEWNGEKISFEFLVPPAGNQQNNYETMITSGDFPTLMSAVIADSAPKMYESEMIMDITDLVTEYMPNYYGYIQNNEIIRSKAMYNVDGEDRILALVTVNEDLPYDYFGTEYRRDWIVKYGKNPVTGAAFTGQYTDPENVDSWEDDVVFPSGGPDPVYISDWEWMFGIFEEAMADLGITDSYCTSMYYPGYTFTGGLCSCFGEGIPIWYKNSSGKVEFGGDQDGMRSYFQCLNSWYEKGWLDPDFNERTGDAFYTIDDTAVRQGKVGMWVGTMGQLGGRLDLQDGGLTEGIFVAGCAWPINDVYGPESCQNVEPWSLQINSSLAGQMTYVMEGADEKDLATLFTFLDYLYTEEGAVLRSIGMNAEQNKESGSDFYEQYGLTEGTYTMGEDGRYKICDTLVFDSGALNGACNVDCLPGLTLVGSVDNGYGKTYEHSLQEWVRYKNRGQFFGSDAVNNMTSEDKKLLGDMQTKVLNYMEKHAYEFIKGITDIDSDEDWGAWCTMLEKYNYQKINDLMQPYIDAFPNIG